MAVAAKGPTELELSVIAGYKHPARSLTALRKDLQLINQLGTALKNYRLKKDVTHLKRAANLVITLSNVFQVSTLEYAIFAMLPNEQTVDASTLLFSLKLLSSPKQIDKELAQIIQGLSQYR